MLFRSDHADTKRMLSEGTIELMAEKVETKVGKKKVVKLVGQGDAEVHLKDLEEAKAIKIVADTHNRELLQRWTDEETRHKVKRALDKQMEPFKDRPLQGELG